MAGEQTKRDGRLGKMDCKASTEGDMADMPSSDHTVNQIEILFRTKCD